MCHYCGAVITDSDGKNLENGGSFKLDDAGPMCLCKVCKENQEQETMKPDNRSLSETPMLSPMPSLSSCNSDCSTVANLDIRDGQEGATGSSQEDIDYRQESMSQNLREVVHSNDQLSGRDDESVMPINSQEAANNGSGVLVSAETERSNSSWMNTDLWDPPEPEDPEDHMEGGMGYNDDDDEDDEFGDGREWSTSSSFSRSVDEASVSYRFKEEKQRAMQEVMNGKYKAFIQHFLKLVGVTSSGEDSENWVDIVCSLSWEAATFLKPLVNGKAMDPEAHVKVKCIATGTRSQSQFVKGMVFKKHAAHKHMPIHCKNPKLILIKGMLGEAPISRLSSFNSMDQENDFTNHVIEMIEICNANVILVEKTASRVIQEAILKKGMTLVLDMKLHRLERIALCTGSPILTSETLMSQKTRQCDAVYFQKIVEEHAGVLEGGGKRPTKTLMFIEGCPTRLGCTVLLKGAHSDELKRVKFVVQCAVVMAFHLILETSFLVDQRAMFATIPFGGVPAIVSPDPQSPLEPCNPNVHQVENATNKSEPPTDSTDIYISSGSHEEASDESNLEAVDKPIMPSEPEPYNPAIFSGFSSISDSLKRVMGDGFLLTSPYQSLSSYFVHGRDLSGLVPKSDSIPSTPQTADQFDVEVRGSSDEENSVHEQSVSHQSTLEGLGFHDTAPNCSEDTMQKKTSLDSQSILVLMSSRNALKGTMCEQSHFSHIVFYKNFDVPLGKFLQENLLNQNNLCSVCDELPEAHFYYYAHYRKQLSIQVKQLPVNKVLPGETEGKLWMWSRCSKCKSNGGPLKSTKRVLISTAARGLSFGRFLELCFSDDTLPSKSSGCGHSLFGDFLYFFGLGNMVAMFRYSEVAIYTVSMPPQKLEFNSSMRQGHLIRETENVYTKGMLLFTEIAHSLKKINSERKSSNINPQGFLKDFSLVEEMLNQERSEFEVNIQNSLTNKGNPDLAFHKYLSLNRLRLELLLESCIWDQRLQSLTSLGITMDSDTSENVEPEPVMLKMNSNIDVRHEGSESIAENDDTKVHQDISVDENVLPVKEIAVEGSDGESGGDEINLPSVTEVKEMAIMDDLSPKQLSRQGSLSNGSDRHHSDDEDSQVGRVPSSGDLHVDRTTPISTGDSTFSKLFLTPFSEIRQVHMRDIQRSYFPELKSFSSYTPKLLPAASDFINEEGQKLHISLGNDNFIVSDYEGELSSVVACVLALLKDLPLQTDSHNEDNKGEGGGVSQPTLSSRSLNKVPSNGSSDSDSSVSSDEYRFSSFDRLNLLDTLVPETFKRADHEGVIKSLAKGKYLVNCPYFNQFRDLRTRCCPSELHYIASLSRCINWNAKGGKSKSFFAKTLDDRFIIKEIKKTEYDSFMKFAPEYFKYINQSFDMGNQTCLAKVLGIYQVMVREPKSGKEMRHDLMVMENLSFGRNIIRQYDLKGALHARYNPATDNLGEVLLDQNFVNDMNSSPLYVSNQAKRRLQRAIWNDTAFLNSINVMDYSLLVGVDAEKKELVCGIIDYLRQYTWDKQLETWVKSSLIPKNVLPTVVSPREYKRRFRKFMSVHFLSVPDHWCLQQNFPGPWELCGTTDRASSQTNGEENGLPS